MVKPRVFDTRTGGSSPPAPTTLMNKATDLQVETQNQNSQRVMFVRKWLSLQGIENKKAIKQINIRDLAVRAQQDGIYSSKIVLMDVRRLLRNHIEKL